ncbi:MAG: signal peptidase I, partial [Deltaproteobacteria bacterium]|nr:signal peptidase I [Deltaproteobacteria bacterium]
MTAKKNEEFNKRLSGGDPAAPSVPAKEGKKKSIRETVEAVVIALVLALVIRTFVIQAFKIPSGSMEDTLLIGDHIIVSKFSYGIQVPRPAVISLFGVPVPFFETRLWQTWGRVKPGDIIVFRFPSDRSKDYIKRVIGTPGDVVEVRDKVIYLNGARWEDAYGIYKGGIYGAEAEKHNFGPFKVPEGQVFVMGDNRDRSYDSRYWGTVPIIDVKGRALIIYWSWDK